MLIVDDRPEHSLLDSILRAIGWLVVYYFVGQLIRQYVPLEVFQSLLEFLEFRVPPTLLVVIWIVLFVLLFVVISRMPRSEV